MPQINTQSSNQDFYKQLGIMESSGKYNQENQYKYLGLYQMGEAALVDAGYYKKNSIKVFNPKIQREENKYVYNNKWDGEWKGKNGVHSKEDFLNNPRAQDEAIRTYHSKVWDSFNRHYKDEQGKDYSIDFRTFEGKTINGIKLTKTGMIAGGHLVGG